MATAAVIPNWYKNLPEIDDMKETGRKITTSENVVAITASPISAVASFAARIAVIFFSSTNRKMFSRTTIASSITTPTIKTNASIVTLFSVKSSAFIIPNVEITEAGIAIPAIKVDRHERINASTTRQASMLPRIR
jgi:hypothetical protein